MRERTLPTPALADIDRRSVLQGLATIAASAVLPSRAMAAASPLLPVDTPGLDHLDVMVADAEKTTRFYMGLLRTALHAQPFQGAQRYFVLLGTLPQDRAVGYLAVGNSRGRGTYIGHFCTSVVNWQRGDNADFVAAMKERFAKEGFGEFPGITGFGGLFNAPDGLEIQFLPAPDKLVVEAVPSDLVPSGQGLVVPQRVDSVVVHVGNLDRAVAWYRILYGKEASRTRDTATFRFRNGSHLVLEATRFEYGHAKPRIARFGIKVAPFDSAAVRDGIARLGGTVVDVDGQRIRLRDADGTELDLVG